MNFVDDLFISYRHIDNKLKDDQGKGWVDNFHERLEYKLAEILGYEPKIWRDTRLPGNAYIPGHLQQRLRQTNVLISILSPGYVKSPWCVGELNEFCRLAEETGGLEIEGKLRAFKVIKLPPHPEDKEPQPISGQSGYSFYEINQASRQPEEFGQELGLNRDKRYWDRLTSLAWAIKKVLDCQPDEQQAPRSVPTSPFAPVKPRSGKGVVYLAETTSDRMRDWERVKSELEQFGYEVLPDRILPRASPDYEQAVMDYLKRARLSVHMIGSRYAFIPEGAGKNAAQLQIELAVRLQGSSIARLIWMPADLHVADPQQQGFIQLLKEDSEMQRLAELRIEKVEDLKTFIIKKLEPPPIIQTPIPSPYTKAGNGNDGPVSVYLVFDADDCEEAYMVEEYLFKKGYEVLSSKNWSKQLHESYLKFSDSLLVFYNKANDSWLNERRADLLYARGLRDGKKFHAKAFYICEPPETEVKKRFMSNNALVLRSQKGFDPSALDVFFNEINRTKGAA